MEIEYREVKFDIFCATCKHADLKDTDEPCCECLEEPTNMYTEKPVRWKAKE